MRSRGVGRRGAAAVALVVAGAAGLAAVSPASAATTVPNACSYSIDGFIRDLPLTFAGTPAPAGVAPGAGFALTGATASADLPAWIPQYGYNFGILKAGQNDVPTTVWVALGVTNGSGGPQVRRVAATATTTITTDAGGNFASATPISVTVPLGDTFWTAGTTGATTIAQAGPGSISPVTLASGSPATPRGSVFIEATLPGGLSFQLDCQPGVANAASTTFTPAVAAAFATATIDRAAPPSGIARSVTLPVTPLSVAGRRVRVPVRCAATTTCRGSLVVTTAARVKVGRNGAPAVVTVARGRYTVLPGRTGTVSLALTPGGRSFTRTRAAVAVKVTATPLRGLTSVRRVALRNPAAVTR